MPEAWAGKLPWSEATSVACRVSSSHRVADLARSDEKETMKSHNQRGRCLVECKAFLTALKGSEGF